VFTNHRLIFVVVLSLLVVFMIYAAIARLGCDVVTLTVLNDLTATPTGGFSDVKFPSRDHQWIVHAFYMPGQFGRPVLINVHGYRGTRHSDFELGRAQDMRELGYTVLTIDLKDAGGDTIDNSRISMGYSERWDVLGAFDYLLAHGFTAERIGVVGESMGATTELLAAAIEPRLRAIWADSPYADTYAVLAEDAPAQNFSPLLIPGGLFWDWLLTGDRIWEAAPINDAATLAANHQAVYLVHDQNDTMVFFHHSVELNAAYIKAGVDVTFWAVPGLDHIQAITYHRAEYLQRLDEFFGKHLVQEF